jgi:hypothetical protein
VPNCRAGVDGLRAVYEFSTNSRGLLQWYTCILPGVYGIYQSSTICLQNACTVYNLFVHLLLVLNMLRTIQVQGITWPSLCLQCAGLHSLQHKLGMQYFMPHCHKWLASVASAILPLSHIQSICVPWCAWLISNSMHVPLTYTTTALSSIVSHSDHKPRVHSICRTKLTTFLPVWICSTTSSHQLGSAALAEIISSLAKMHAIMHQVTHHINKAWVSGAVNLNTTQLSPFVTSSIHYQLCSNSIIMQSTSPCPVHILLLIPHPYHMVCHPTW